MRLVLSALALLLVAVGASAENAPFLLAPGEFRVVDLHVPQTPLRVDASYQTVEATGNVAVHMELLPKTALRAMLRGQEHEALASTANGASGTFRNVIEEPGDYRIIVINQATAAPANVVLNLSTDLSSDKVATELSPRRRVTVIAVSFLLFFAMVSYSGWKLRKSALS